MRKYKTTCREKTCLIFQMTTFMNRRKLTMAVFHSPTLYCKSVRPNICFYEVDNYFFLCLYTTKKINVTLNKLEKLKGIKL